MRRNVLAPASSRSRAASTWPRVRESVLRQLASPRRVRGEHLEDWLVIDLGVELLVQPIVARVSPGLRSNVSDDHHPCLRARVSERVGFATRAIKRCLVLRSERGAGSAKTDFQEPLRYSTLLEPKIFLVPHERVYIAHDKTCSLTLRHCCPRCLRSSLYPQCRCRPPSTTSGTRAHARQGCRCAHLNDVGIARSSLN